jgi:Metallo-peptidase family M12B Reprolysin-like/Secretion system C-terminal sorting domain
MKKLNILALTLALSPLAAQKNFWTPISANKASKAANLSKKKQDGASFYNLNLDALKKELSQAPLDQNNVDSPVNISLPTLNGEAEAYQVWESPILVGELAAQFPDIKTYVAKQSNGKTLRFTLSNAGIEFGNYMDQSPSILEPISSDAKTYRLFKDVVKGNAFKCGVKDKKMETIVPPNNKSKAQKSNNRRYHTFRFAILPTYSFTKAVLADAGIASTATDATKKNTVLRYLTNSMNNMNVPLERDLGVHLVMATKALDLISLVDNKLPTTDGPLGTKANTYIAELIGDDNFDLGHGLHYNASSIGGSALPILCSENKKADGGTVSDVVKGAHMDIDFLAHEVGHQLGADHTFAANCGDNIVVAYAVEPGSGSSIMAYGDPNVCSPTVQTGSDPFFHTLSIDQIQTYLASQNCVTFTDTSNTPPTVTVPKTEYSIPKSTAFKLTGTAVDAETVASRLSYCWEQTDIAARDSEPSSTQTKGPVYRFRSPLVNNGTRYFPQLSDVIAGDLTPTWEVTPSVARALNFRLTVRDGHSGGGQTGKANVKVNVVNVGPFAVTSQAAAVTYNGNSKQTITWDVAGTTANNINVANVKITLSTDSGLTFPTVLSASTANNGTATVTMPNVSAANCRIMVEAVGNVFYAVNSTKFALKQVVSLATSNEALAEATALSPNPNNGQFKLKYQATSSEAIQVSISNMIGQLVYDNQFENKALLDEDFNLNLAPGHYVLTVKEGDNIKLSKKFIVK